eukprot:UN07149
MVCRRDENKIPCCFTFHTVLIFEFICGLPSLPQYYRLTTANDATQRDPTEWTLRVCDISTDICFTASETVNNPPTNRRTVYPEIFSMIGN